MGEKNQKRKGKKKQKGKEKDAEKIKESSAYFILFLESNRCPFLSQMPKASKVTILSFLFTLPSNSLSNGSLPHGGFFQDFECLFKGGSP
jgi:hypothetical protein